MYSRFCYYIQKEEEKRNATMHIPRKPGQQIEVDWAGDPAHIIDVIRQIKRCPFRQIISC